MYEKFKLQINRFNMLVYQLLEWLSSSKHRLGAVYSETCVIHTSVTVHYNQVFARSRKMVIPITHQSLVKNRDFNHSPITISNGDSNHSPITNQITLHNFLGSNFDYYISNKYSFSIITVVQSASQSILTYFSEKYCLQSIIQG